MKENFDPRVEWHETLIGGVLDIETKEIEVDQENMWNAQIVNLGGMSVEEYMKNPLIDAIASGSTPTPSPTPTPTGSTTSSASLYTLSYSGYGITQDMVEAGNFSTSDLKKYKDETFKKDTTYQIEFSISDGDMVNRTIDGVEYYDYYAFIFSEKQLTGITNEQGIDVLGNEWIELTDKKDGKYVYYSLDDENEQSCIVGEETDPIKFKVKF